MSTATTEPTATRPTDAEIAEAYAAARRHAVYRTRRKPDDLNEAALDAAADSVVWALAHYDPTRGAFGACASATARVFVARAIAKHARRHHTRPASVELNESIPAPRRTTTDTGRDYELGEALKELPPDLRDVVRFFYIDRFNIRDCALLMGCAHDTVRGRLKRAAEMLAESKRVQRPAEAGRRRLLR